MKKIMLSVVVCTALIMSSCGAESDSKEGGDPLCECVEAEKEMKTQRKAAGDDEAKIKEIKEAFEDQAKECKELMKKFRDEMKEMDEDARKKKKDAFEESCPAAKR
jgi:gas vesicle protein